MLEGADHGRTTQPGVMRDLLARADEYEKEPGINVVSIQVGFTWSDIPYTGPSIAVSHEPAAEARAKEIARLMIDEIWRRRDEMSADYRSVADGVAAARPRATRRARWCWPTAPTIPEAAATTTPRRCCRPCSTPASRTRRSARSTIRARCSRR